MQHKGLRLTILIFVVLGLTELNAQSTMYVKEIDGNQTSYSLSNIEKLSFSEGNLVIDQANNNSDEYHLGNLNYLSFSDSTYVNAGTEITAEHNINVYPNPVSRELLIDLSDAEAQYGTIYILSLEGKLMFTQQAEGSGIISVNLGHLPSGTYICQFISKAEIKSIKLIKL